MQAIKKLLMGRLLWELSDPVRFSRHFNAYCKMRGRSVRILSYDDRRRFLVRQPDGQTIYVGRIQRIKEKYLAGDNRLEDIFQKYLLMGIEFQGSDAIIDVGANIGELSICLGRRYGVTSIACEPDPIELGCLAGNLEDLSASIVKQPLWESAGEREFFFRNQTGDSSLLLGGSSSGSMTTMCTTLNEVYREVFGGDANKRIRLLKLEAEGAEPEILRGGEQVLRSIDYISADLGPERGLKKENTVAECVNFLLDRGFKVLRVDPLRAIFLFRNELAER